MDANKISVFRLIFYLLFNIFLVVTFIVRMNEKTRPAKNFLFELSSWGLIGCLVYYLAMFIMDVMRKTGGQVSEKASNFFNARWYKVVWPIELTCCLGFWGAVIIDFFKFDRGESLDNYNSIALHVIIPACCVIDLFVFPHMVVTSYWIDCVILTIVWVVYEVFMIFGVFVFKLHIYRGIDKGIRDFDFGDFIVYGGVFYFLTIGMYLVHQFGLMIKMGIRFGSTTVKEDYEYKLV